MYFLSNCTSDFKAMNCSDERIAYFMEQFQFTIYMTKAKVSLASPFNEA